MRLVTDFSRSARRKSRAWNTNLDLRVSHPRGGSTAVQEVAFTLADGLEYLTARARAGLDPAAIAPRLSFFFNVHNDFLEEIAKFARPRTLWRASSASASV